MMGPMNAPIEKDMLKREKTWENPTPGVCRATVARSALRPGIGMLAVKPANRRQNTPFTDLSDRCAAMRCMGLLYM